MHLTRRLPLVVALGVCLSMTPVVLSVRSTARQPPSATLGAPEDTPTTSPVRELDSPSVTVKVRAMVPQNVKVSDPAQGTVRATVRAVDGATNRVTVQTQEGQMLILQLPSASLLGMRVGDQFTLQVAQRSLP